jgi:hypothetical protein
VSPRRQAIVRGGLQFIENRLIDRGIYFDFVNLRAFEHFAGFKINLRAGEGELHAGDLPEVRPALLDSGGRWIDINMQRPKISASCDQPALGIDIKSGGVPIVHYELKHMVISAIHFLSSDQLEAMTPFLELVQAKELSGKFYAMAKRSRRLIRRGRLVAFTRPLPSMLAVKGFRENVLAAHHGVDPHPPRTCGAISAVHFKTRIDNVQINPDRLHRLDRGAATDRFVFRSITWSRVSGARLHPSKAIATAARQLRKNGHPNIQL